MAPEFELGCASAGAGVKVAWNGRLHRALSSPRNDGVDVAASGAASLLTLMVLWTVAKICHHGTTNVLDNGLGTQFQPVAMVD